MRRLILVLCLCLLCGCVPQNEVIDEPIKYEYINKEGNNILTRINTPKDYQTVKFACEDIYIF